MSDEIVNLTDLSDEQRQRWDDTRALVSQIAPGFQHLFHRLLCNNDGKYYAVMTKDVPVAATDAKNILINPDTFFQNYKLAERAFIVAHEIVHNMYGDVEFLHHCVTAGKVPMLNGTTLPFDMDCMQKSMDERINALLVESRIGIAPKDAHLDPKNVTGMSSILDVYAKNYKKKPKKGDGEGDGEGDGDGKGGGFDKLLPPGKSQGKDAATAASERNQQQWQVETATAAALEQARRQGNMAGALGRLFKEILEPEVPWQDKIRTSLMRHTGSNRETWDRPDRRFIGYDMYLPSMTGNNAGWIVVLADTSGSIGNKEMCAYLAELTEIMEGVRPKRMTILWNDTRVHHITEVEGPEDLDDVRSRGVPGGGGGTNLKPAFDWMQQHPDEKVEVMIAFTDGYFDHNMKEPDFPVIWASVVDNRYPFGEVVRIMKRMNQ